MLKNEKKLIIVAHASTGSGHTVAANSIAKQLKLVCSSAEIRVIDILDYFPKKNSGDKFVSATSGALAPVFDYTWRKNFTGKVLWGGGYLWPSFLYKKFEEYICTEKPDLVVCTHQVCANSAAKIRLKMYKKFAIVSVPTDYEIEGLWPHKHTDLFCVANEQMAQTLIARKVPEENILISGLPVEDSFENDISNGDIYNKFGFPKDKKLALVIAGASESGPYKNIRNTLNDCIKYFVQFDWMHFIFCVGNDYNYESKLKKKINKYHGTNISVIRYTDDLAGLMSICDIALVKPGGLIVSECVKSNLPILLVGKTYAQENINRRYLVAMDAAEHAVTYKGVINLLCDIFSDEERYYKLKNNLQLISHQNSALKIASAVNHILEEEYDVNEKSKFSLYIGKKPAHTR